MTPPQEPPGRRGVFNKPPGFPIDVGAACTPPGNVATARDLPGKGQPPRRGTTPPSSHTFAAKFPCGGAAGWGSRGLPAAVRRGQDPALQSDRERAACRPPLQPNGNWEFLFWIRNSRKDAQTACPGRFSFSFRFSPLFHRGIFGGLSVFLTIFPRFAQGFPHFQQSFPHFPRGKGGGYGGKPGANGAKPMVFPGFFLSVKNSSQQVHLLGP